MSRICFHTRSHTAELRGAERAWLRHIAGNVARPWWGLDNLDSLDRALEIVEMIVPGSEGQYVRNRAANYRAVMDETRHPVTSNHAIMIAGFAEQAQADRRNYKDMWERYAETGNPAGQVHYDHHAKNALVETLRTCLQVTNVPLKVGDHVVHSMNVEMNTAIAVGYDAVALAAKIHGWCEIHPWINEADRSWLADTIEYAIDLGLYRDGIWYNSDKGKREWISQGWDQVMELLRDVEQHPGEVVLSASVCDQFPNAEIATTMPPWPDGVPLRWECLDPEQQEERSAARRRWGNLTPEQRWESGFEGLEARRPWANITPDNLSTVSFGPRVDLLDLFHHDRDNRIQMAFERDAEDQGQEEEASRGTPTT